MPPKETEHNDDSLTHRVSLDPETRRRLESLGLVDREPGVDVDELEPILELDDIVDAVPPIPTIVRRPILPMGSSLLRFMEADPPVLGRGGPGHTGRRAWSEAGFDEEQQRQWVEAGIPVRHPSWAVMCQASATCGVPGLVISPETLRDDPAIRRIVLDGFQRKRSLTHVLLRIARQRNISLSELSPSFLELYGLAIHDQVIERHLKNARTHLYPTCHPRSLPSVAEDLAQVSGRVVSKLQILEGLRSEALRFETTGEIGRKLSLWSRVHGIVPARLSMGVIRRIDPAFLRISPDWAPIFRMVQGCATHGTLVSVGAPALDLADKELFLQRHQFRGTGIDLLRVDQGLAVVQVPSPRTPSQVAPQVLVWRAQGDSMQASLFDLGLSPQELEQSMMTGFERWDFGNLRRCPPLAIRLVLTINMVIGLDSARRRLSDDIPRGVRQGDSSRVSSHTRDRTSIEYHTLSRRRLQSTSSSTWTSPDHRWKVRGHWRHLPTPEDPTRKVWVTEHTSGPSDRPLITVNRVHALFASSSGSKVRQVLALECPGRET